MGELILFAWWDKWRERYSVEVQSRHLLPPHPDAEVVCLVDYEDRHLMLAWALRRARRGWTPQRMRAVCEGRPWKR